MHTNSLTATCSHYCWDFLTDKPKEVPTVMRIWYTQHLLTSPWNTYLFITFTTAYKLEPSSCGTHQKYKTTLTPNLATWSLNTSGIAEQTFSVNTTTKAPQSSPAHTQSWLKQEHKPDGIDFINIVLVIKFNRLLTYDLITDKMTEMKFLQ